jgi:hypothetical protein
LKKSFFVCWSAVHVRWLTTPCQVQFLLKLICNTIQVDSSLGFVSKRLFISLYFSTPKFTTFDIYI